MKYALDSGILCAALQCATGASNALLRELAFRRASLVLTAPLVAEYRTVLMGAEQRLAHGRAEEAVERFMAALVTAGTFVAPDFLWRPRLSEAADELLIQAAVMGRADALVTLRPRRFAVAADFDVRVVTPASLMKGR